MKRNLVLGCALGTLALAAGAAPGGYTGPTPPKPDVPYLMHADNLIETEVKQAAQEDRRNETLHWVSGASSPVRTPLAEPIFLFESDKIAPDKLELYRFNVRGGRREIIFPKKGGRNAPRPYRLLVTRIEGNLYRVEANEALENGEYSLSPDGSDQVFCFQVY